LIFTSNARTLSGSPPFGVRTFLFHILYKSDCPTCFNLQGSNILAKIVQQTQFEFVEFIGFFGFVEIKKFYTA